MKLHVTILALLKSRLLRWDGNNRSENAMVSIQNH